jgi:DNA-binding transcriptional LysR family regulator
MNSDDLAVFAHVAKTGSISRTAMELGADQSTVSRRIAVLEAELGVRLFRRSGRGVGLTERGAQLLGYAQTLERTLDEARGAMRSGVEAAPPGSSSPLNPRLPASCSRASAIGCARVIRIRACALSKVSRARFSAA